ncbi:Integrase catalytic region [Yersinia frederiksenii ATCC 33641]|nr:Integrase catalytic region [Yersinia frederiksenii ATCC 33641]
MTFMVMVATGGTRYYWLSPRSTVLRPGVQALSRKDQG